MRDNKYDKAGPLLEKIYNATPADQRSRALVLNHAIIDLTKKVYVMRALRDLDEYLTKHRAEDEQGTNILGAALNIAADNPSLKRGPIWQSAYREWNRRNYVMDHSRPGSHRWGVRWISDQEYEKLQKKRSDLDDAIARQEEVVRDESERLDDLARRQAGSAADAMGVNDIRQFVQTVLNDPYADASQKLAAGGVNMRSRGEQMESLAHANELYKWCQQQLAEVKKQQAILRELYATRIVPDWPTRFDPIEANQPTAAAATEPVAVPMTPSTTTPASRPSLYPD